MRPGLHGLSWWMRWVELHHRIHQAIRKPSAHRSTGHAGTPRGRAPRLPAQVWRTFRGPVGHGCQTPQSRWRSPRARCRSSRCRWPRGKTGPEADVAHGVHGRAFQGAVVQTCWVGGVDAGVPAVGVRPGVGAAGREQGDRRAWVRDCRGRRRGDRQTCGRCGGTGCCGDRVGRVGDLCGGDGRARGGEAWNHRGRDWCGAHGCGLNWWGRRRWSGRWWSGRWCDVNCRCLHWCGPGVRLRDACSFGDIRSRMGRLNGEKVRSRKCRYSVPVGVGDARHRVDVRVRGVVAHDRRMQVARAGQVSGP